MWSKWLKNKTEHVRKPEEEYLTWSGLYHVPGSAGTSRNVCLCPQNHVAGAVKGRLSNRSIKKSWVANFGGDFVI